MVGRLDRFDEVWAETHNLPSPYAERQREIAEIRRIAASQALEIANMNHNVLEMLRRNGTIQNYRYDRERHMVYIQPVHSLEYIEMSFVVNL